MAIADLIHSCGLPFSLASHHKFHRVLSLAKVASKKYIPPGRNKVAGELLDLNYQLYKQQMMEMLQKEADIYGITFFGDGATVKKAPLINILASSVHLPVGCLRIVDCTGHLENDGRKDAAYISELFLPHITEMEEKVPKCTDLVIFDGASNVQKAGQLLAARFPHVSVIHGAEHVISLFYHDVFLLREFDLLKRMNRLIYKYFGSGSMHSPYAIFSKQSRDHNGGKSIGLIRAADTRMAGHVISMLRTLRLKDPLLSTISSASFIQGKFKIEKKLIDVLKRDSTWEFMTRFIRAVFPMLIVLRLADQKDPVMDKLYFYVRRMDQTLEKSKVILDDLEEQTRGVSWRILNDLDEGDSLCDDSESENGQGDKEYYDDSTTEDEDANKAKKSLGQRVIDIWRKRRDKLVTDFAIAGWMVSPMRDIYEDARKNMDGDHRDAVDRLLEKMVASEYADDSEELAKIMNTFWDEFEHFRSKSGHYQKTYIWSVTNSDLTTGKSYLWHKKNSLIQTKVFGKFACRVCSKIVGMGSAERSWGDVKHLKSMKRSHLSAQAVEKQATIFGASCMADAALERQKAQENTTDPYKFWDDADFDKQFDMFADTEEDRPTKRYVKCYLEDWEQEYAHKKDDVSEARLLTKYGGLEFDDIDNLSDHYKICNKELAHHRTDGWCVKGYKDGDTDEWTPFAIDQGEALHDCLSTYYTKHPEKNVVPLILKNNKEVIADLATVTETTNTKKKRSKKRKSSVSKTTTQKAVATSESANSTMEPCGKCGQMVQPVHRCDKCMRAMHVFCGRTIGDEGHGAPVRCSECDDKNS